MDTLKAKIRTLPDSPGIYQFYSQDGELLYVGKSVSIRKRVASYFATKDLGPKTTKLVSQITNIGYIKVFSEFEALMLESDLIRQNKPFYNVIAKDDKSPIYIKITKEEVPLIALSRKTDLTKGEFVKGPFPSSKMTKLVLKQIRKILPYCQHKNPKKPCLYVHLGLCPYPYNGEEKRETYLKTIKGIKLLLKGKVHVLKKELTDQMKYYAAAQKYEKASETKKRLQYLEYLTMQFHDPKEFLNSPGLVDDTIEKRVEDLKQVLNLSKKPNRIECYDISNVQGKNATGSMVVFAAGVSDKSQYRRFRVRVIDTPNDFLMMEEVLTRRFKNDWPLPDLIVIDGGKGQLGIGVEVLNKLNLNIPIIGLAKRYEEIYQPDDPKPIKLKQDSPARQLLQAIRDEAHRFAITYHRKLRSLNFLH